MSPAPGFFDCHVCGLGVGGCGKPACKLAGPPKPTGAMAYRQCVNPDCLAEEGERHQADCTPAPTAHTVIVKSNATTAGGYEACCCTCSWGVWQESRDAAQQSRDRHWRETARRQP